MRVLSTRFVAPALMVTVMAMPLALLPACGTGAAADGGAPDVSNNADAGADSGEQDVRESGAPDARDRDVVDARVDSGGPDARDADAGSDAAADVPDAGPAMTNIEHVVVIVQENHTFDNYFGRYCTATPGSSPTCNQGPACCEAAPDREPSGALPVVLDDSANGSHDPNHTKPCESSEMNGGRMDRYVTGADCSDARNFAIAPESLLAPYHDYARSFALADRYFQPIIGQTSANDMYFAIAKKQFDDNEYKPDTLGAGCTLPATRTLFTGRTTIADLLIDGGYRFAFYAEGYAAMKASSTCPAPPSECNFGLPIVPCDYDPSDVPFEYYTQFADNPQYMKDFADFGDDIDRGALPEVSFIKPLGYHNEHPGYGTVISAGINFVTAIVDRVLTSAYADNTLIILTWDEGGGFFDHVSPSQTPSDVDGEAHGTRVPMLAIGRFARSNFVSHVEMEHSSIVRFLEFNFLGDTGQLGNRDAVVHNIGSMLDPAETGIVVPAD